MSSLQSPFAMAAEDWDADNSAESAGKALQSCPSANIIQVAKRLVETEERLLDTERDLITAVKRTIALTEGMIGLVKSTTITTHRLMAPGPSQCVCERIAVAKNLVKVVQELNQTAGRLNHTTDRMIQLSNNLAPREETEDSCLQYLGGKERDIRGAVGHITEAETTLHNTVLDLGRAVAELHGAGELSIPEKDSALRDLIAMTDGANQAAAELRATAVNLKDSADYVHDVAAQLEPLDGCPNVGAKMIEQLECPVCYQVPVPPQVWVCRNGHSVCASCRPSLQTCPACRGPLGYKAAVLMSAWLRALRSWCRHRGRGCPEAHTLADRAIHEDTCRFRIVTPTLEPGAEAAGEPGRAPKLEKSQDGEGREPECILNTIFSGGGREELEASRHSTTVDRGEGDEETTMLHACARVDSDHGDCTQVPADLDHVEARTEADPGTGRLNHVDRSQTPLTGDKDIKARSSRKRKHTCSIL